MPKDAHLLCPMSQALLQAARAGRVNPTPSGTGNGAVGGAGEEDGKPGAEDDDAGAGREDADKDSFIGVRWQLVPRHLEGPEVEYLAKRRKGLGRPSTRGGRSGAGASSGGSVVKRVTIRRTDADGNTVTEEVLMAEGQTIDGEILAEVTLTDAHGGGTLVDGVGLVNADGFIVTGENATPSRRRPPPPRRKPKGPGRGRKKKVQFSTGTEGVPPVAEVGTAERAFQVDSSSTAATASGASQPAAEGAKTNDEATLKVPKAEDTEMADDSNLQEADDDDEEGEEGEAEEDDDREEGELSPSPDEDGDRLSASPTKSLPAPAASAPTPASRPPPPPPVQQQAAPPPPPSAASRPPPLPQPPALTPVLSPTSTTAHQPTVKSPTLLDLRPTGLRHPLPPKPTAPVSFVPQPRRASAQLPPARPLQAVEILKPGMPGMGKDGRRGSVPHLGSPAHRVEQGQPMRGQRDTVMTDVGAGYARGGEQGRRGSGPWSAGAIPSPSLGSAATMQTSPAIISPTSQSHDQMQPQAFKQHPFNISQFEVIREELTTGAANGEAKLPPPVASPPSVKPQSPEKQAPSVLARETTTSDDLEASTVGKHETTVKPTVEAKYEAHAEHNTGNSFANVTETVQEELKSGETEAAMSKKPSHSASGIEDLSIANHGQVQPVENTIKGNSSGTANPNDAADKTSAALEVASTGASDSISGDLAGGGSSSNSSGGSDGVANHTSTTRSLKDSNSAREVQTGSSKLKEGGDDSRRGLHSRS